MKANYLVHYLSDVFPYRRKSSLDWILPVSVGLGVALGVGVGVLIAPTSGEQTRRRLRSSAERVKERARSAAQRAQESLQEGGRLLEGERTSANDLGSLGGVR